MLPTERLRLLGIRKMYIHMSYMYVHFVYMYAVH